MKVMPYINCVKRSLDPLHEKGDKRIHVHGVIALLIVLAYVILVVLQCEVPHHLLSALTLILGFLFGKHYDGK